MVLDAPARLRRLRVHHVCLLCRRDQRAPTRVPERALHEHFGVPADLFSALLASPSRGSFVSRFIRGKCEFRRLCSAAI
ncbi:MAG: KTSC domain-containing protein [Proteobacteria bacterium]|nr:KTSC domain-containing protein [Pseudomonadota bacterium]